MAAWVQIGNTQIKSYKIISYSQLTIKPEMSLQTSSILDHDVCELQILKMNSWRKILLSRELEIRNE